MKPRIGNLVRYRAKDPPCQIGIVVQIYDERAIVMALTKDTGTKPGHNYDEPFTRFVSANDKSRDHKYYFWEILEGKR